MSLAKYAVAAAIGAAVVYFGAGAAKSARAPAKEAVKRGLRAALDLRVKSAQLLEAAEDFIAEVKHEMFEEAVKSAAAGAAAAHETGEGPAAGERSGDDSRAA